MESTSVEAPELLAKIALKERSLLLADYHSPPYFAPPAACREIIFISVSVLWLRQPGLRQSVSLS